MARSAPLGVTPVGLVCGRRGQRHLLSLLPEGMDGRECERDKSRPCQVTPKKIPVLNKVHRLPLANFTPCSLQMVPCLLVGRICAASSGSIRRVKRCHTTKIPSLSDVTQVAARKSRSFAVSNGAVFSWGALKSSAHHCVSLVSAIWPRRRVLLIISRPKPRKIRITGTTALSESPTLVNRLANVKKSPWGTVTHWLCTYGTIWLSVTTGGVSWALTHGIASIGSFSPRFRRHRRSDRGWR